MDRDEFQRWVESLPEGAITGCPYSSGSCPLAQFLRSQGCDAPVVGATYYHAGGRAMGVAQALPSWAVGFRRWVDRVLRAGPTREQALEWLARHP